MAPPGLLGGMARPYAARSAALAGGRPRAARIARPNQPPDMTIFAFSTWFCAERPQDPVKKRQRAICSPEEAPCHTTRLLDYY